MSDSLSRLVEAVRSAGVDIAPGYCEYVRLAFAIANDCGEAGREGFIALCSLSVKFNREKAERLFSNSLKKGDHRIHLGTAFHLAELAGVRLEPPSRPRDTHASNASNANNAAPVSHTRACDNNVEIEIEEQVDPFTHLPSSPRGMSGPGCCGRSWRSDRAGSNGTYSFWAGSPPWAPRSPRRCGSYMEANGSSPVCKPSSSLPPPPEKACSRGRECSCNRSTTRSGRPWRRR